MARRGSDRHPEGRLDQPEPGKGPIFGSTPISGWTIATTWPSATRELYRYLLDRYILSKFGDYELIMIKPSAVRSSHSSIAKDHPTTAAKAYRLFATIMRTAVDDRQLSYNPVQIKGASKEEAPERPIATDC